ncbi:uncharacterized protein LOC131285418 [Anopheles ziemanni]|uniref:uncharacterized protein LOC131266362 n=1 Tax=Anopheles coustani TaxID=139045 RepID=UPI00265B1791|nr:uncharacterized protein LOC131266362 [Anopheles coustani]XP_058170256.1 uncharacterized protein LOC131285418 [Anopheles ziemanni]
MLAIFGTKPSNGGHKLVPFLQSVNYKDNLEYLNSTINIYTTATVNRIDVGFSLTKTLVEPWINIGLWVDVGSGVLRTPLYNRTVDFCHFLRNPGVHRLGQIVHREMKQRGNMPTRCPIPVNLYQFRGVSLNHMRLPPFFVETDFILDVNVGVEKERTFDSRWFGTVKKIKCSDSERCS